MSAKLSATDLVKKYGDGELSEPVLHGVSLDLHAGESCLLMGPSGSGKTTLLSHLGCLLKPTSGTIQLDGRPVSFTNPAELAEVRRKSLGFVFQHAQLLPFLSVEENLALVARNSGMPEEEIAERSGELLGHLELEAQRCKPPGQLSGGQRQRVAIARSLIHSPSVVLADEPTAALDWSVGRKVVDLLIQEVREGGAALLVVTHDQRLLPMFDRSIRIEGGRLSEEAESNP